MINHLYFISDDPFAYEKCDVSSSSQLADGVIQHHLSHKFDILSSVMHRTKLSLITVNIRSILH